MSAIQTLTASVAVLLVGLLPSAPAATQDIFTTEDFRQDRTHWTDPAYYRNNTADEMREMDMAPVYGLEGTGRVGAVELASPYPYTSASEHYQAWFETAGGGTQHTRETVPDWRGRFTGGDDRMYGGPNKLKGNIT